MPGPLWISSPSAARRHGAYALERTPTPTVRAIGTGVAAIVLQCPWGPDGVVVTASGPKDLIHQIAPPGMPHTGAGFLSVIGRGWPTLKFVRALGPGAAAAKATLLSGTTPVLEIVAKCKGAAGNALVATVSNAGDGVAAHFKLTVTVAGPSGVTSESFDNLDDVVPSFASATLVGGLNRLAAGRPPNGMTTFGGGSDGALNALAYTGTPGTGNQGIAALEADLSVRHVCVDDPGGTLRPAVNAALRQHAEAMGDRVAYVNGSSGQSLGAVASDVGSVRSARVVYVDPWVYVLDELGVRRLVPPASFAASAAAQLSPSTSIAWKDPEVIRMLGAIHDLEFDRGNGAADNTEQGVVTIVREEAGGFSFEAGVVTLAPQDPARRNLTRTRMGDYAAVSMVRSSRSFIDAPNVPSNQQAVVTMVATFMEGLKAAQASDPNHSPHCLDYAMPELRAFNTPSDLEQGWLTVPVDMKTSSGIEKLFFSMRFGETTVIRAS